MSVNTGFFYVPGRTPGLSCSPSSEPGAAIGTPTGYRKLTPAALAGVQTAEAFCGLPEGVTHPGQILAALKAAAPFLGLPHRLIWAIDWMFRFTKPQDWEAGARPIVWPSARLQQEELLLSPTRVKALNRALIEAGLLTVHDSPNGKRYGRRDVAGRIVEAYGFDLSPLAVRYAEFRLLTEDGRCRRQHFAQLRRRITIAHKALAQTVATAEDFRLDDAVLRAHLAEARQRLTALPALSDPDELEDAVLALEEVLRLAALQLQTALAVLREPETSVVEDSAVFGAVKTGDISDKYSPKGAVFEPHNTYYKANQNPYQDTVTGHEKLRGGLTDLRNPEKTETRTEQDSVSVRVFPEEFRRLAPQFASGLEDGANWAAVLSAANRISCTLGISRSLWERACDVMGAKQAALAIAIVSERSPDYFTRTPGHYFRGMVRKAEAGDLHLIPSLWRLRRAPESQNLCEVS